MFGLFSNFLKSPVLIVDEILLTELIESLLDWQEKKYSNLFMYEEVNFRAAFARYFYFSAINQPSALLPLIAASRDWAAQNKNQALLDLYKEIEILNGFKSEVNLILRGVVAYLKVCFMAMRSLMLSKERHLWNEDKKSIGFFVINPRFLIFFKETITAFKEHQKIIFSNDSNALNESILTVGASPQKLMSGSLSLLSIHIPIFHPLFFIYANILQAYTNMLATLSYSQPSVLVFAEGTSMQDEISSQAAKKLSIPTVRMQSGRGGVMHCGYRGMSFDKMLCWGEGFVQHYKRHSPRPVYEVTGTPLFNDLKKGGQSTNNFTIAIFTQPISKHISEQEYAALTNICTTVLKNLPDAKVIVRKHPVDSSTVFDLLSLQHPELVKLMPATEYTLTEVMNEVVCAVGFYSTTLSEAAACNVIPIIMKMREQHSMFPFPEEYGAAIIADGENATFDIISNIMKNPKKFLETREKMKSFSNHFFGINDGQSLQRVVESILRSTNT
ncbi:hypothetical protein MB2181_05055 [Methylophilales bacterium HTCC2181]|uniref:Uncharacterized protein n=1 Tax=Methylophilales bacterium HTCC2181 TaxID=383631 RepID=A0P7A8_9PROT|nr:hypothetical protein MB2181_05055 [Methylophilales bacterium HTCC2181]